MGCSVYAKVVIGHRKAVKSDKRSETITKFNENDGKPYQKTVFTPVVQFGNKEFTFQEWGKEAEKLEKMGFELFTDNECSENAVGFVVAETEDMMSSQDSVKIEYDKLAGIFEKAHKILEEYVINTVEMFLLPCVSC